MTKLALRQANHTTAEVEEALNSALEEARLKKLLEPLSEETLNMLNKGVSYLPNRVLAEAIAEPGEVPEWMQLTPNKGKFEGRDGRSFNIKAPTKIVRAFNQSGEHLVLDVDHESEMFFGSTVASGWVTKMAVRNGGEIWGKIEFTANGERLVTEREFRSVSPVFQVSRDSFLEFLENPDQPMEVEAIVSVALTNKPNLRLRSLNNQQGESNTMDREALIKLLGLNSEATDEQITEAITALKSKPEPATSAPQPNASEMVPRADYDAILNKLRTKEEAEKQAAKTRFEAECRATVDAAVEAGKIPPVSKDYHLNTCLRGVESLNAFRDYIGAAPEIAPDSQMRERESKEKNGEARELTSEERLVCRKLNITAEEFLKSQKNIQEDEETYHPKAYAFVH